MKTESIRKGFTLIELLVVIAILAILATVIVVIINPGELMKQARDTTRISDIAAVNNAIGIFVAEVPTASIASSTNCTSNISSPPTGFTGFSVVSSTAVSGSGWIPANFGLISSGSPLPRLPLDPVLNNNTYAYCFKTNGLLQYELATNMESNKYKNGGSADVESKDGGNDSNWYGIGSKLDL